MATLPRGWVHVSLANIADVQLGKMLSAKSRTGHGSRPYLRNINVRWNSFDLSDVLKMDFSEREVKKYGLLQGDVLVCEGGEPGRAAVWRERASGILYQKALHRVRFVDGVLDPQLFVYQLEYHALSGRLVPRFTGSTIKHLPRERFLEVGLDLPPLAEQRRIVAAIEEHLSRLDAAVGALERVRTALPRYRAAVLKAGCEGALNNGSKGQWDLRPLGEFLEAIDAGKSFKCDERVPRGEEVGVVKVSAVTWGEYDEDESKTVRETRRVDPRYFIKQGDFLFSRANTIQLVGTCVIAKRVTRRLMLSDKILRLRLRVIPPDWALVCLRSPFGRSEIERLATGNQESMRNIGQDRIKQIRVPAPSAADIATTLAEVDHRLSLADAAERAVSAGLAKAKRLRQAILKRAFEGKLVPQDPNDEPATVLLERIRAARARGAESRGRTRSRRTKAGK